jgi:hypothetical protein
LSKEEQEKSVEDKRIFDIDFIFAENLESSDKVYESIKRRHLLGVLLGM